MTVRNDLRLRGPPRNGPGEDVHRYADADAAGVVPAARRDSRPMPCMGREVGSTIGCGNLVGPMLPKESTRDGGLVLNPHCSAGSGQALRPEAMADRAAHSPKGSRLPTLTS